MVELLMHPAELWKGIGGPIKVVQIGQEQVQAGWLAFLRFGGIISFNLAVFNLLPLPALDGGRLAFLAIEKVVGRKRSAKVERWVHGVGIILLIGLLVVVTVRDIFA
jgi:regulator of sigma E protease